MNIAAKLLDDIETQHQGGIEAKRYAEGRDMPRGMDYFEGWNHRGAAILNALKSGLIDDMLKDIKQNLAAEVEEDNRLLRLKNEQLRREAKQAKIEARYQRVLYLVAIGGKVVYSQNLGRYRIKDGKKWMSVSSDMVARLSKENLQVDLWGQPKEAAA